MWLLNLTRSLLVLAVSETLVHAALIPHVKRDDPEPDPATYDDACNIGFCSIMGATIGGWGADYKTVKTYEELVAAVSGSDAGVVIIEGALSGNARVPVGSGKTIVGAPGSSLSGVGLYLNGSRNVIVRNLKLSKVPASQGDAIAIENSRSIWVDHCDLSSDTTQPMGTYGNLISVTKGSDYITISNNLFHDHQAESVTIGKSDADGAQDSGKLHVTLARNYFKGVGSAISLRFGTGHVINSYFENVASGINTRMGAEILVESSVFEGQGRAVFSADSSETGSATLRDVLLGSASNTAPAGEMTADSVPYPYDWYIWEAAVVKRAVARQAGQTLEFMIW